MKKASLLLLTFALAALLCYGVARLFSIRFAQGDVYPAYSTLSADGIGSKALYESLDSLLPVQRNYRRFAELVPDSRDTAFFLFGSELGMESDFDAADLDTLAQSGGRVVIAFLPYDKKPVEFSPTPKPENEKKDEKKEEGKKASPSPDPSPSHPRMVALHKLWGEKYEFAAKPFVHALSSVAGLEPQISWHGSMYFDKLDPAWRALYTCGGKPVIIERAYGKGSIVLAADSYFTSNEALSKERAPGLISALVGSASRVVFDETHLGVSEHNGVAALARQYHLEGVVLALLVVAGLFVWRNAVAFVPADRAGAGDGDSVRGLEASVGFVNLLKRNIPLKKLVETCVGEWKHSAGRRIKPATIARVEQIAAGGAKQPIEAFQMITQILNEK